MFYARRAFPGQLCGVLFPGCNIVSHTGREHLKTELQPIKQATALTRLIRQCPWATCDAAAAAAHLDLLAKLAQQAKSYSFAAGRDVFADPASISNLITEATQN